MTQETKTETFVSAAFIAELSPYLPIDMIISSYTGDKLVLRAGRDSSAWSDFELIFGDISYMALPAYMNSVTVEIGGDGVRKEMKARYNALEDDETIFELIEDEDWAEGVKRHVIIAKAARFNQLPSSQ